MGLLDDLKAVGAKLPSEVKPVAEDVADVIAGLVHVLGSTGVLPPGAAQVAETVTQDVETAVTDERPTVGSLVADVAPGPPAAPEADPLTTFTVEQLTDELAKRQQDAIKTADEQKSQVGPVEPA